MALRIIHVGLGQWGQDWHEHVLRPTKVEVAACVEPDAATLAQARQRLDLPAERCFSAFEDALEAVDADAALITASLPAHVPLALAAIAAGKHVLIEKPFAPTLAEARQVVDAAEARGLVLMVSQNYRFFAAPHVAAALVREAKLGPVGAVSLDFRRYANGAPREGHRHYTLVYPLLMDMTEKNPPQATPFERQW